MSLHFPSRARRPQRASVFHPELSLVERNNHQRRDLWRVCGTKAACRSGWLTCVAPSRPRRARRQSVFQLYHTGWAHIGTTTLLRDGRRRGSVFVGWLSATAADGQASAKLGPAHTFSLSLGALERMESRHSLLLFTWSISDKNASHTESCCWVRFFFFFCLLRLIHSKTVDRQN